jgi:cyclopropane fatty-acyl-phospholipid synthase-like methyltransferase
MKEFWNQRYGRTEFAYGTFPNVFFANQLTDIKPGKALFPAEGEGRNAVFAAKNGWDVLAFDISEAGKTKAEQLAKTAGVQISYEVVAADQFSSEKESFDLLVLIFAHFPEAKRREFHRHLIQFLRPGGMLILEAFSKEHIHFNSANEKAGGPKDLSMLYAVDEL